ncbi:MAG: phage holin family protein [Cytophagales bacterium]|nr:phage holin family protein [Cytophagales bacterium]
MILKFLITAVATLIAAYLLPGVEVDGFWSAFVLAALLAILNVTVKPILLVLTIPATVLTLGLFILVINALVIMLADAILSGFYVENFWWAFLFSLVLWLANSFLKDVSRTKKKGTEAPFKIS